MQRFTDAAGVRHVPGDIVDLPGCYDGEAWLERIEPEPKPEVPPAKVEPAELAVAVPLEASKKPRKAKKAK